jgi:fructoselysine-6-P-deglycase FrlB-like protein
LQDRRINSAASFIPKRPEFIVNETTNARTHIEDELASQPGCWEQAVAALPDHVTKLPARGERVAVVGCGTSLYIARAYAALREAAGHGETDAFPASEYRFGRGYDRIVAISRSGTTTEILDVIDRITAGNGSGTTVAIAADATTPIATATEEAIILDFATEQSVVQTRFPTSALILLRASLGEDLDSVIAAAPAAVTSDAPVDAGAIHQITFLGRGWAAAIAEEAALKCREAAGFWTEAYPAMEYRHGPISVSAPGTAVWVFGTAPGGLASDVAGTGAQFVSDDLDPLVDLIRAQRLAVALAHHNGRDPDSPQSLTFSVVLDTERR